MSALREAAQQALEALLWQAHAKPAHNPSIVNDAITGLRAALAEPEQDLIQRAILVEREEIAAEFERRHQAIKHRNNYFAVAANVVRRRSGEHHE